MASHLLPCWACDARATVVVLTESPAAHTWHACCSEHPIETTAHDRIVGVTVVVQGG